MDTGHTRMHSGNKIRNIAQDKVQGSAEINGTINNSTSKSML